MSVQMDPSWESFNLARLRMEALMDPAGINVAVEIHDKSVFAKVSPFVVKVLGIDQHGTTVGEFSGFLHCGVIVTAGHEHGFSGKPTGSTSSVETFKAVYSDGSDEVVTVLRAPPPPSNVPDLMLLKGSHNAAPQFRGKAVAIMETVYAFRYSSGVGVPAGQPPSCSKGLIASVTIGAFAIATNAADNGFSGGPVVDRIGRLVGVIRGGLPGTTVPRVDITSSFDVHTFLLQAGQPGLST